METTAKKSPEITEAKLKSLLGWLDADRDKAAQKLEHAHKALTTMFRSRGCTHAEELADRTTDTVANQISRGKEIRTTNPLLYFRGVANNILKKYWQESGKRQAGEVLHDLPQPDSEDDEECEKVRLQCMKQCLKALPQEDRYLIVLYDHPSTRHKTDLRERLAKNLKISLNAVRIRAHRIKKKLHECLRECLRELDEG